MRVRFVEFVSWLRGEAYNSSWNEKIEIVLDSLPIIVGFFVLFTVIYLWFFWRDRWARTLFLISAAVLFGLILGKYTIFHFFKGYIADRLILYAIPSPKAVGVWWLGAALVALSVFLRFRERIENFSAARFLTALYIFFVAFSVSVAGAREGAFSVYEPFSRVAWEYTGNLPLVEGVNDFLSRYRDLQPQLAHHTTTHPPGYTIVLYLFSRVVGINFFALSAIVVMVAGLTLVPLYHFLRNFLSEREVRRGLECFIAIPGAVLMSATSMEAVFLFFTWTAIALVYRGWRGSIPASLVGGIVAGAALFMNFTFLLLAPFFTMMIGWLVFSMYKDRNPQFSKLLLRVSVSVFGFVLFFSVLLAWSGYSIVENFEYARFANQGAVRSNFESLIMYGAYFLMNALAFGIYLGIPLIGIFCSGIRRLFAEKREAFSAFVLLAFFLLIGVFQGEVGRLWLYWMPIFVFPLGFLMGQFSASHVSAMIAVLAFQCISIQMTLYTYW